MYFHIILSETCDSQCRYCYGKSENEFGNKLNERFKFDFSAPPMLGVDVNKLKKFIEKDEAPHIIFYGGEPLVNRKKLIEIMDNVPHAKFYIQTNAKLLNFLSSDYVNKFEKILVSIDGDRDRTDFNRGDGTYDKVIENIKAIRDNGYGGEIVARMTISFSDGFNDLVKQVKHLFSIGFDSVHWQLDMGFYEYDYNKEEVSKFLEGYNKQVDELVDYWMNNIAEGKVLKIYPFLGIVDSLLKGDATKLRCGSGYANYTITTDGTIVACPVTNNIIEFEAGNIETSNPNKLKEFEVGEPCTSCEYIDLCGGRCLYSNYAKLWPEEGQEQICSQIKFLIDLLKSKLDKIKELINDGVISSNDFEYEKYFGPEIIP